MSSFVIRKSTLISRLLFVVFWIVSVTPFLIQETIHIPNSIFINISLYLAEAVVIALGCWVLRDKTDIAIIVIFTLYAFISTCIVNNESFFFFLNGLRTYIGFLFVIPIIRYFFDNPERREKFVTKVDKTLYLFLWVQVPAMLLQCLRYGAYDNVGGTLGWNMSGVISTLIYLCSFYLMLRRWDYTRSFAENIVANKVLLFLLLPSYLNETKVSFIFLLFYFILLNPIDKKFIKRLTWILPLVLVALAGALYLYYALVDNNDEITTEDYATVYLIGNDDALEGIERIMDEGLEPDELFMGKDVTRGIKFFLTPPILRRSDFGTYTGYGVGQCKNVTSDNKNAFTKEYEWILRGTMMQGFITWIELGAIGLALYFFYWLIILRLFKKCPGRNKQLQWYLGLTILIFTLYNNPYYIPSFYIIFSFLLFASSRWNELPRYIPSPIFLKRIPEC